MLLAILAFGMWLVAMYHQLRAAPLHFRLMRLLDEEQPALYNDMVLFRPFRALPLLCTLNFWKFHRFIKTGHDALSPQAQSLRQAYKQHWDVACRFTYYFIGIWIVIAASILVGSVFLKGL